MTPLWLSLSQLPLLFSLPCHLAPCNIPDTKHSPIPQLPHQSIAPLVRTIFSFLDVPLLPPSLLHSGSICINGHCGSQVSVCPCHTHHTELLRHLFAFAHLSSLTAQCMASMCTLVFVTFSEPSQHTTLTRTSSAHWEQRTSLW